MNNFLQRLMQAVNPRTMPKIELSGQNERIDQAQKMIEEIDAQIDDVPHIELDDEILRTPMQVNAFSGAVQGAFGDLAEIQKKATRLRDNLKDACERLKDMARLAALERSDLFRSEADRTAFSRNQAADIQTLWVAAKATCDTIHTEKSRLFAIMNELEQRGHNIRKEIDLEK